MASWVQEFIGNDVRIVGVISERPVPGVASLSYWLEANGQPDVGPFLTIEMAMMTACLRGLIPSRELALDD